MNNTAKKESNDRRDILNPLRLHSSVKVIDDSKRQKCWLGRVCMLLKDVLLSLLNVCKRPVCFLGILECTIASPSKSTNTIEQLRKRGAQGRRSSLPPNSTKKEQLNGALFHSRSESHLSQNRKLQLGKLLMTNVGNGAFLNFWRCFRTYFVLYPRLNSSIQSSSIE